jgi:hypothetical protein
MYSIFHYSKRCKYHDAYRQVSRRFYAGRCGPTYLPLTVFQSRWAKKGISTAKQAFTVQMRAIPGVSAAAAMGIGERFGTVAKLNRFLKDAMSDYTAKVRTDAHAHALTSLAYIIIMALVMSLI